MEEWRLPGDSRQGLHWASARVSNARTVQWTVNVGTPVTGVRAANFTLSPTVTGASVGAGTGTTWMVPVTTGTGDGTLQLNLT
jgi:large repetitive protein